MVLDEGPLVTVPDFSGMAARQVAEKIQQLGLELSLTGSGLAVEQSPAAGRPIPAGSCVDVRFSR